MYVLYIVVCPFVLFLLAIVLSVLLRFTDSDYPLWYPQTVLTTWKWEIYNEKIDMKTFMSNCGQYYFPGFHNSHLHLDGQIVLTLPNTGWHAWRESHMLKTAFADTCIQIILAATKGKIIPSLHQYSILSPFILLVPSFFYHFYISLNLFLV